MYQFIEKPNINKRHLGIEHARLAVKPSEKVPPTEQSFGSFFA